MLTITAAAVAFIDVVVTVQAFLFLVPPLTTNHITKVCKILEARHDGGRKLCENLSVAKFAAVFGLARLLCFAGPKKSAPDANLQVPGKTCRKIQNLKILTPNSTIPLGPKKAPFWVPF